MNNKQPEKTGREKRRYYRINDEINLSYRKVDSSPNSKSNCFSQDILDGCSLASTLDMLTEEAKPSLRKLERSNPDAAECYKILEKKISLLSQIIVRQEPNQGEQKERKVSISAAGIAFACSQKFQAGDILELKLILPSSMTAIVTKGRVIHCNSNKQEDDDYPYSVAIDYQDLKKEDREALVKHVVKRQLQQIQDYRSQL